jgi:hypothetical protein
MNSRRVASYIDDVLADRRPGRFKGGRVDADVLRAAIAMRAARPGEEVPEERFVADLRHELAQEIRGGAESPGRPVVTRRARFMVGAAAVVTMMGGAVAATTTVDHALAAAGGRALAHGQLLRMGTFQSTDGRNVGQIVAYRGDPSWVFMSIRAPGMNGTIGCQIQLDNGHTAAAGTFVVHNGVGQWARTVPADVGRFRGATLVTAAGSTVATASFSGI